MYILFLLPSSISTVRETCVNHSVDPHATSRVYATQRTVSSLRALVVFSERPEALSAIIRDRQRYRDALSVRERVVSRGRRQPRERERRVFPGGLLRRIIYADRFPPRSPPATRIYGARARHSPGVNSITGTTLLRAPIFHSPRSRWWRRGVIHARNYARSRRRRESSRKETLAR